MVSRFWDISKMDLSAAAMWELGLWPYLRLVNCLCYEQLIGTEPSCNLGTISTEAISFLCINAQIKNTTSILSVGQCPGTCLILVPSGQDMKKLEFYES